MEEKALEYTPTQYFEYLKERKHQVTDEDLQSYYENAMMLVNKYNVTGQVKGLRKLIFHAETIEKERELVKMGIDTFVYRDDVEYFMEKVSDKVVKIIELKNYPREIPDEIVEVISKTKDIFTEMYVVFTDYTGEVEKEVEKSRRDKDPILFGTFQDRASRSVNDRFYFLGDWEDDFCDLTLDKMVAQMSVKGRTNIERTIVTPTDLETLKADLERLDQDHRMISPRIEQKKKTPFQKVKTFFSRKKVN